jgi:hypothetical protein
MCCGDGLPGRFAMVEAGQEGRLVADDETFGELATAAALRA